MLRTIVKNFGIPREVVCLEKVFEPEPAQGCVIVDLVLRSINPSDLIPITGAYKHRTPLPFVPGFEGFGRIAALGEGVEHLKFGQRVLPIGKSGLWAEKIECEERWCFAVPEDLSDRQAATSYVNPLTAINLIDHLFTKAKEQSVELTTVGVSAGASAIGKMLLHLLKMRGVKTVAYVRSEGSALTVNSKSVDEIALVNSENQFVSEIPIDGFLDCVGGDYASRILSENISENGVFVQYGLLSGVQISSSVFAKRRDVSVSLYWLRQWVHSSSRQTIQEKFDVAFNGIREGYLTSKIEVEYPLGEISRALEHVENGNRVGKILLR